jgi:siroheme synthase
MQIDLDPRGRKVVIFGDLVGTRQAVRRLVGSGATVTLVVDGVLPGPAERIVGRAHRGESVVRLKGGDAFVFFGGGRSTMTTIGRLPAEARRVELSSPAVVVIGEVVAVAPGFAASDELVRAFDVWSATPSGRVW